MKDVVEVYRQKVAELQHLMRELEALRLVAPLLTEEGDLPEALAKEVFGEKKEKQEKNKISLP